MEVKIFTLHFNSEKDANLLNLVKTGKECTQKNFTITIDCMHFIPTKKSKASSGIHNNSSYHIV